MTSARTVGARVAQHQVGRLAGDGRAPAYGHRDVGALQGWRVVHPVAGAGHRAGRAGRRLHGSQSVGQPGASHDVEVSGPTSERLITLALAGDTMLGRSVGARLAAGARPESLVAPEVAEIMRGADLTILNLECCISDRGTPWPAPGKPFFFRAPPAAVAVLQYLGVEAVTLANNHALDYGPDALLDTRALLEEAGIAVCGAGHDAAAARQPLVLEAGSLRLGVIGFTDHPEDFAAGPDRPGVALADLDDMVPGWLLDLVGVTRRRCDALLVTPHWGPNLAADPQLRVRAAATALVEAGASLVAGHSAHVFQGVAGPVLFDLGDFLDDYAVEPRLRNDLGLLWLVSINDGGPGRVEAVPLALDFCFTRLADADEFRWIERRLARACAAVGGATVSREGTRLVIRR